MGRPLVTGILHKLTTRHTFLERDDVGRIMICQHFWPPWRYRTNWHAYFNADGSGDWREIGSDELDDVIKGELPRSWGAGR
jgi:hypothetical protein